MDNVNVQLVCERFLSVVVRPRGTQKPFIG